MARLGAWLVVTLLILLFALPAKAAPLPATTLPIGIEVSFPVETSIGVRLKACFSTVARTQLSPDAAGLDCQGQTWNGSAWLNQTDSWADFPLQTTHDNQVDGILAVQNNTGTTYPYLYVVYLVDGSSSSSRKKAPLIFDLILNQPTQRVVAGVFEESSRNTNGWIVSQTRDSRQWWPIIGDGARMELSQSDVSLEYRTDAKSIAQYQQAFRFNTAGSYKVLLNQPAVRLYQPTIIGPVEGTTNANYSWTISTQTDYDGPREWFVDGQLVSRETSLTQKFDHAGQHTVTVRLGISDETSTSQILVHPYRFIRLIKAIPAPESTQMELLELRNIGDQTYDITNWSVVSDQSTRRLKLTGIIEPNQIHRVEARSFFVNRPASYTLLDASGEIIDRLIYSHPQTGEEFYRPESSIAWQSNEPLTETTRELVVGTIARRLGRGLDVVQADGREIHMVIDQPNFPKVSKGQSIQLTGVLVTRFKGETKWRIDALTRVVVRPMLKPSKEPKVNNPSRPRIDPIKPIKVVGSAQASGRSPPITELSSSSSNIGIFIIVASIFGLGMVMSLGRHELY